MTENVQLVDRRHTPPHRWNPNYAPTYEDGWMAGEITKFFCDKPPAIEKATLELDAIDDDQLLRVENALLARLKDEAPPNASVVPLGELRPMVLELAKRLADAIWVGEIVVPKEQQP